MPPRVSVWLGESPIEPLPRPENLFVETGAVLEFAGVVRQAEAGRAIRSLFYEAYRSMAQAQLEDLARRLALDDPIQAVWVWHRLGWVEVGQVSLRIEIHSRHRAEGLRFCESYLDALKRDVPIWKADSR